MEPLRLSKNQNMRFLFVLLLTNVFLLPVMAQKRDRIDSEGLLIGIGVQRQFFIEVGYAWAWRDWDTDPTGVSPYYLYISGEYQPAFRPKKFKNLYAYKVGGGVGLFDDLFTLGLEAKWQTDFRAGVPVLTPQISLGANVHFALQYGYNIFLKERPFEQAGRHQVIFRLIGI
jgi:hypothetical protein